MMLWQALIHADACVLLYCMKHIHVHRPPLNGSKVRQMGIMMSKFSDTGGLTAGFRTGEETRGNGGCAVLHFLLCAYIYA